MFDRVWRKLGLLKLNGWKDARKRRLFHVQRATLRHAAIDHIITIHKGGVKKLVVVVFVTHQTMRVYKNNVQREAPLHDGQKKFTVIFLS